MKICSICLESVKRPAILKLNCNCKYDVHYSCYMTWWRDNKNCIICHESSNRPKYNKKYKESRKKWRCIDRKRLKIKNRITSPCHNIIYPDRNTVIYHRHLNRLPFDNENELKTIIVGFVFIFIIYYFLYYF